MAFGVDRHFFSHRKSDLDICISYILINYQIYLLPVWFFSELEDYTAISEDCWCITSSLCQFDFMKPHVIMRKRHQDNKKTLKPQERE